MSELVIQPQEGAQELAINIDADVIFLSGAAGSAKSFSLLMRMLRYIDDPHFDAIYFRRTGVQIKGQGGLWDNAKDLYNNFGATCLDSKTEARFHSGAKAKFMHMELEKNKMDHQGLQYSMIAFDELTHFSETQFTYLMSRLRSESETSSFVIASMNPDCDSWVLKWIMPYLDEEGYIDPEMNGKIMYFVTVDGEPVFHESREYLIENFRHLCYIKNTKTGKTQFIPPKSFVVIGSTIFDNQLLIDKNPNYLAELNSLPPVEKARLLHGNWFARPQGSGHFKREWLGKVDRPPVGTVVRAWDKASEEPSEKEWKPDFTASIKMIKTREGRYCICGDWIPEHSDSAFKGRFRKRAGARDVIIGNQALHDGDDCIQVLPVDPAAAGKVEYQESAKKLIELGVRVKPDPMPTNKSKLTKFMPFSSACENGLVDIYEDSFPDKQTLEFFYKELEAFDGERSTRELKDDWADCTASAFNYLAQARVVKIVKRNQQQVLTNINNVVDNKMSLSNFDKMEIGDLYN